jgi:hypothetical protein
MTPESRFRDQGVGGSNPLSPTNTFNNLQFQQRSELSPWCGLCGCPLDKSEGGVKDKNILSVFLAPFFAREDEDQDSGNLTLNHPAMEDRSTNHRFGHDIDHDSSMRTSRPARDARAPNQLSGLACADQGHPRAALDANDLWICHMGAQHPVESYR